MRTKQNNYGLLKNERQLGPYPMELIKRVDKPTNLITDQWQRIDGREIAFSKAAKGEYGPAVQASLVAHGTGGRDILSMAYMDIARHTSGIRVNDVSPAKAPIPDDPLILSRHVKRLGYFMGADVMGICELPESAVYKYDFEGKPVEVDYKYAILVLMEKEYRTGKASEGWDWIADPMSFQSYQKSAMVALTLADYIRRLGYPALAQYGPSWYQVQITPLLLLAGMGEVCRVGIVLNPFLGINYKAAAVLTNMPLVPDKPIDFGLQDFCRHCDRCAKACPSQAISKGKKVIYNGYETWKLEVKRCASFVLTNKHGSWCNTCVKVCPWTRPHTWEHNFVRRAVTKSGLARKIAIKADSIRGIPEGDEKEKWWFDLGMEDGKVITTQSPESEAGSESA